MICETEWCENEVRRRKTCNRCAALKSRGHDFSGPPRRKVKNGSSLEDRLTSYGWTVDPSGCWLWAGNLDPNGYGYLTVDYKHIKAHRASLSIHLKRELERHEHVLHSCDNTLCVNPDHLSVGTHAENMSDMAKRLRAGRSKLTPDQVREIRALAESGMKHTQIGPLFGVTPENIRCVVLRMTWAHVD